MESSYQGRDHVAVFGMVVVTDPVQIGRHHRTVVGPVLNVVGLAHLDPGDLRDRVGLVRGLERASIKDSPPASVAAPSWDRYSSSQGTGFWIPAR